MEVKPNPSKFIEEMQRISKQPNSAFSGVSIAKVLTVSPYSIQCGDQIIPQEFLYVSPLCEIFETEIFKHKHTYNVKHHHTYDDHDTGEGAGGSRTNVPTSEEMIEDRETSEELKKVVVWRGLKVGDEVLVLRTGKSQQYVLLCRVNKLDDRT